MGQQRLKRCHGLPSLHLTPLFHDEFDLDFAFHTNTRHHAHEKTVIESNQWSVMFQKAFIDLPT